MCSMKPQLVRSAGHGAEVNACYAVGAADDLEDGDGRFAVFEIYHLMRTVERVGAQRQRN